MSKILIIGPAYPLRGGLATFNERMARAFSEDGHDVVIYTFSLQYPSLLFPGKTQYSESPPPEGLIIHASINTINPVNWIVAGRRIAAEKPDIIIVRYWMPFMAPSLGSILRMVKRFSTARIIALVDNAVPHEKRPGDSFLTRYFIHCIDGFVTMSNKVADDLSLFTNKKSLIIHHPLYDTFGKKIPVHTARQHLGIGDNNFVYLFFGFIRHYKGLDLLLDAFEKYLLQSSDRQNKTLLIAGEFYSGESNIKKRIETSAARDHILLHDHFIRDDEVAVYFSAADCVVQPYRTATQSGVTPLAYHFEVPMIVTRVGALPDMVPEGIGLVCDPDTESIVDALRQMSSFDRENFAQYIVVEKNKYSWQTFVREILSYSQNVHSNG